MTETSFTALIEVDQSPAEAFEAINNVRGWWHGDIEGATDKLHEEFTYRWKEIHYSKQRVTELKPFERIAWLITDSSLPSFKDKSEWTGTTIVFDITASNGKTQIRFTQKGLVPSFECYGSCSQGWGLLIQQSLLSLITTGKGVNVFG